MQPVQVIWSLRSLLSLEARVGRAKLALQRTSGRDPAFERRIRELMRLVELLDRAIVSCERSPERTSAGTLRHRLAPEVALPSARVARTGLTTFIQHASMKTALEKEVVQQHGK